MSHLRREIWIHDEPAHFELYSQLLSVQFELLAFDSPARMAKRDGRPALVIAEAPATPEAVRSLAASESPLLLVSRNDSFDFMRACLKAGACGYLLKPLRQAEVFMTLEKALNIEVLPSSLDGHPVPMLTLKERQLLAVFLTRAKSLTRAELHESLWQSVSVNRKTLDVHLFNLRRKIHPCGFDIVCEDAGYSLVRTVAPVNDRADFSLSLSGPHSA